MKTLEHELSAKEDPRKMTGVQLARLGIQILNKHDLVLKCVNCGEIWTAQQDREGKFSAGYWICPNKCNL